jgi:acetyl esterase/lipase
MDRLYLPTAPPLDPAWLAFEEERNLNAPKPAIPILERQPLYAEGERVKHARMMAPGARDHHLSQGIQTATFTVPSSLDGYPIPVLQLTPESPVPGGDQTTVIYIHGGGLMVGEADSEELSCRRIVLEAGLPNITLYSIGYRLLPTYPASTCVQDCLDVTGYILSLSTTKVLVVGSSSGGELASFVAAHYTSSRIHGLALRCPVTSDSFSGLDPYVPQRLRQLHTSSTHPSFRNCLMTGLVMDPPRNGLPYMPLEMSQDELRHMPRTWLQVCTNDGLYSDGMCLAKALEEVGVEVEVDVVVGWPHTFWLKAPELQRALEAERDMCRGLSWLAGGIKF